MADHPWLRQPKEPARAYQAFTVYRDLGPTRSLRQAYRLFRNANGGSGDAGDAGDAGDTDKESDFVAHLQPSRHLHVDDVTTPAAADAEADAGAGVGTIPSSKAKGAPKVRKEDLPGRWVEWSRRYKWAERAQACDDHYASIRDAARRKVTAEMAEKWARRRDAQREKDFALGERLQQRANKMIDAGYDTITPSNVAKMAEAGSKLSRLAIGMPTDHTSVHVDTPSADALDLHTLSEQDFSAHLRKLAATAYKLAEALTILEDGPAGAPPIPEIEAEKGGQDHA